MLETSTVQKICEKVNHKLCENDSFNGITKVLGQQQKRRVIPVDQQISLSFLKKKTVQVFVQWVPQIAGARTAPELFLAPKDHSDLDLSIGKRSKGALWKLLAQGSTGPHSQNGTTGIPGNHLPYQTAFCCRGLNKFDKVTHEAPNLQNETWDKNGKMMKRRCFSTISSFFSELL